MKGKWKCWRKGNGMEVGGVITFYFIPLSFSFFHLYAIKWQGASGVSPFPPSQPTVPVPSPGWPHTCQRAVNYTAYPKHNPMIRHLSSPTLIEVQCSRDPPGSVRQALRRGSMKMPSLLPPLSMSSLAYYKSRDYVDTCPGRCNVILCLVVSR